MYGLPPRIGPDGIHVTGISCPDCGGVVGVRTEGRDAALLFECRIRHTYDVAELLAAKEEHLEGQMWRCLRGLEELATLLADLVERGGAHGESAEAVRAYRQRGDRLRSHASAIRELIRANSPVDLSRAEPGSSAVR
jgi:hypothetical protein